MLSSTISVSRVTGAGGENCQCSTAVPGWVAQKATLATLKSGPLYMGLRRAPEAKAMEPGPTVTPRNEQELGPLHTSFCRTASNTAGSPVTVLVSTQEPAVDETLSSSW